MRALALLALPNWLCATHCAPLNGGGRAAWTLRSLTPIFHHFCPLSHIRAAIPVAP